MEEDDGFVFTRKRRAQAAAAKASTAGAPEKRIVTTAETKTECNEGSAKSVSSSRRSRTTASSSAPMTSTGSKNSTGNSTSNGGRGKEHPHSHLHRNLHDKEGRESRDHRERRKQKQNEMKEHQGGHDHSGGRINSRSPSRSNSRNINAQPHQQRGTPSGHSENIHARIRNPTTRTTSSRSTTVNTNMGTPNSTSHRVTSVEGSSTRSSGRLRDRRSPVVAREEEGEIPKHNARSPKSNISRQSTLSTPTHTPVSTTKARVNSTVHGDDRDKDASILSDVSPLDLQIDIPNDLLSESEKLRHLLSASLSMVLEHYRPTDHDSYKFVAAEDICKGFVESDPCELGISERKVLPNPINIERQTLFDKYQAPLNRLLAERAEWKATEEYYDAMESKLKNKSRTVEKVAENKLYDDASITERVGSEQQALALKVEQIQQMTRTLEHLEKSGQEILSTKDEDEDATETDTTVTTTISANSLPQRTPASEKKTPRRLIRGIMDL
eukprot:CFRG0176T1